MLTDLLKAFPEEKRQMNNRKRGRGSIYDDVLIINAHVNGAVDVAGLYDIRLSFSEHLLNLIDNELAF